MIATVFLIIAIVLAVVGVVMALTQRPYTNWLIGAGISLVIWVVLAYLVHA